MDAGKETQGEDTTGRATAPRRTNASLTLGGADLGRGHLDVDLQQPERRDGASLGFRPPRGWHSVIAALVKKCKRGEGTEYYSGV